MLISGDLARVASLESDWKTGLIIPLEGLKEAVDAFSSTMNGTSFGLGGVL